MDINLTDINFDMIFEITKYINNYDIFSLSLVCHKLYNILMNTDEFWYRKFIRDHKYIDLTNYCNKHPVKYDLPNWKTIYKNYNKIYYITNNISKISKISNIPIKNFYISNIQSNVFEELYFIDNKDNLRYYLNDRIIETSLKVKDVIVFNNKISYVDLNDYYGEIRDTTKLAITSHISAKIILNTEISQFFIDLDNNLWARNWDFIWNVGFINTNDMISRGLIPKYSPFTKINIPTKIKYITGDKYSLYYIDQENEIYYCTVSDIVDRKYLNIFPNTNGNFIKLIKGNFKKIYIFDYVIYLVTLTNKIYVKGYDKFTLNYYKNFKLISNKELTKIFNNPNIIIKSINYNGKIFAIIDNEDNVWTSQTINKTHINYKLSMIPNIKAQNLQLFDDKIYILGCSLTPI